MADGPYTRPAHPVHSSSFKSSTSSSQSHASPSPPRLQSRSRSPSVSQPPSAKKSRQLNEKPMLRRNQACLSCRKRKLRCDAVKPTCGTCIRSHNYALLHSKTKQVSSTVPSCTYEEDSIVNTHIDNNSSTPVSATTSTSTSAQALEGIGPTAGHWVNKVQSPEPEISAFRGIYFNSFDTSSEPLTNMSGAKGDDFEGRAQSSLLEIESTQPASSEWVLPVHTASPPSPPSPPSFSPSSAPFESSHQDISQRSSSDAKSKALSSDQSTDHRPFAEKSDSVDPFLPAPLIEQRSVGSDQQLATREQIARKLKREFADRKPMRTFPEHLWSTSMDHVPLRSESFERPDGFGARSITKDDLSNVSNGRTGDRENINLTDNEEDKKANQVLMDLLYPGWPPHLPNPMMLGHIVESFFRYIGPVASIFNKSRFMVRLALPPSHPDFPHPAVLHAICAVTSRFLGIVSSTPPTDTAFEGRKVEKTWPKSLLNPVDPTPIWDGLGSKRPGVLGGFFGRDGDFGQVHFSWGKLYVHDSKMFSSDWISCIQALAIMSHYCYQEARWIEAWSMIGDAAQMVSPLGLQTRRCHSFSKNPRRAPVNFLSPPKDDIETAERQNLFACLFGLDTIAASTSGWAPAIDLSNVTSWIPTTSATVDPPHLSPSQDFHSADLFSYHPPDISAYSLLVKSTILVRRVNDYVRLASERDVEDPKETAEFKQLDLWTAGFRSSFPSMLRDPFRSSTIDDDGRSVDEILLSAHTNSLLAVIQLHDPYADPNSLTDQSSVRVQEAVQHLLMLIHQLNATNVDFSSFYPYMGFTWFIAARSLVRFINTSEPSSEIYRISLRNSISVLRLASANIGVRLPVGLRHCWIIDQQLADSEKICRIA